MAQRSETERAQIEAELGEGIPRLSAGENVKIERELAEPMSTASYLRSELDELFADCKAHADPREAFFDEMSVHHNFAIFRS